MKPGVYRGLSREDYEKIEAMNWSTLKHYERSPAHAKEEQDHPKQATDAMEFGNAIHTAILEPSVFVKDYAVLPEKVDRRTKVGKERWAQWEEENAGKTPMKREDWDICEGVGTSFRTHKTLSRLMSAPGLNELTVVYDMPVTTDKGEVLVRCKSRLDRVVVIDGTSYIIDLKSSRDACPLWFPRDAARLGYHGQAALYKDGLAIAAPFDGERVYLIAAFEKTPPYAIGLYEVGPDEIRAGRQNYSRYLYLHAVCEQRKRWPAYPEEISALVLPKWAYSGGQE